MVAAKPVLAKPVPVQLVVVTLAIAKSEVEGSVIVRLGVEKFAPLRAAWPGCSRAENRSKKETRA